MTNSIPWIEKYRPVNIDDVIIDDNISKQINIFLQDRENVHLIITGSPGVGKTSTVRCIAKELLGEDMSQGYLEINAAEDRGVRSISTIIPPFCKKVFAANKSKIILLDEADIMTSKCQYDINNMIKKFGRKTKFIFTCNDSSKIIEDIQSICRILRFKKLTDEQINQYLSKICVNEKIPYDEQGLRTICYISNGDMRKSINDLQKTAFTFEKITKNLVLKICKVPDPEDIRKIISLCLESNLEKADEIMNNIIKLDYCYFDIVTSFIYVLKVYDMSENLRLRLIMIVNETKINISKGLRSKLQLTGMICRLIKEIQRDE
ncbi:putative replication factor C small subunit [Acanthamoeba castellanii mimivirus]|uniref:Putative replication factor C small subunit R395 n=5 Tax=Mimivirus TaxID=315393 RepID=RFCS1_MIMIV|nr:clamp loader of DNA polymerase [Acanthamoeba polyphaga mimivirus]Q5UQ47.1 RecName: Full=Putative replication factor C small subunit R395; Short=RFC small subunit R395; AltName: Full=Clamp loader small subunit R395 [Acanthamoeba polyphaga mimivirus]AHA45469.1 putative replication factor C small subunit [Hirudovirus strain Sangsue]ALR83974.1 putative replication factor C small subunit [Niemeyer virus]AMK61887.1 replication factor c small subunit [Samba virus]AMZ02839.1 putative replication fa